MNKDMRKVLRTDLLWLMIFQSIVSGSIALGLWGGEHHGFEGKLPSIWQQESGEDSRACKEGARH